MAKVITTELQHSGASGANVTLDSSKNVTCENNLTVDGTTTLTGAVTLPAGTTPDTLSFRNKLHNPDFKVWQKGTTFSPTTSAIFSADRWNNANGSSFNQDTTVTRSTDVPTNAGSSYSIKIEADAAVTPSGGDNMVFRQRLEGQDVQDFDFGGANAKGLVASFWCKCNSSAAGAYSFSPRFFDASNNGYGQIHNFTPTTSWARYTFVLPANGKALDTAIINSNGEGFEFAIHLATGSNDVVSAHSTWASQGWAGTGSKNFMDDAANEIYFTGFQLETGSAVTDLEVRSYGDELLRCQRYYQSILGVMGSWGSAVAYSTTAAQGWSSIHPEMRAAPTFSWTGTIKVEDGGAGYTTSSTTASTTMGTRGFSWWTGNFSGLTDNNVYYVYGNGNTGYFKLDAEL